MDLKKITNQVCELSLQTADFLLEEVDKLSTTDIEVKSIHNFVTYVDKSSEARLMEGLSKIVPGTGFIAEESPDLEIKELNWVIDPLDGTTNFIHAIPLYSISIALMNGNEVILGVIVEINRKECFYTWKGAPSFLNGKEIVVSETGKLTDSLFATGFPYYDYGRLDPYMNMFRFMMKNSHGVRRLGSAAADLAYVACGRFDGFYEYGLSPWDVAAGTILVKNAGGRVSDFSNGDNFIFGKEIIATNANLFEEFLARFRENFI
ncbi:MAG: inositol monophosphatase family protein [Bacteroidetes bacterium]|nr:inositol monophosphatase family protein [Bacteroidota bacterium]